MIIKIDVDGVIRDIMPVVCQIYNDEFGTSYTVEDITDYDISLLFKGIREKYDMTASDFFFRKNASKVFLRSKPFDGVREAITILREKGHKVVICTWQFTLGNIMRTLNFLDVWGIKYDDICFTKDKWMVKCDYIIDDNPGFLIDERETGKKIIIDAPYNREWNDEGIIREKSLYDAVMYNIV